MTEATFSAKSAVCKSRKTCNAMAGPRLAALHASAIMSTKPGIT